MPNWNDVGYELYSPYIQALKKIFQTVPEINQQGRLVRENGSIIGPNYVEPRIRESFASAVSRMNKIRHYRFGLNVPNEAGVTAIRNATDLAQYFNPLEDYTGAAVINGELQRYAESFNDSNAFMWGPDYLGLLATRETGSCEVVASCQAGGSGVVLNPGGGTTATALANFVGLGTTAGITVGMLVAVQFQGVYRVSAVVADTSITLVAVMTSPALTVNANLILFLPYYTALSNAAINISGTTVQFADADVPAGLAVGLEWAWARNNSVWSNKSRRVTNISSSGGNTTVTLNKPNDDQVIPSGTRMFFHAGVKAGQIWTKEEFGAGIGDSPYDQVAFELTCHLPAGPVQPTHGFTTKAAFDALPSDAPFGSWITFWLYAGEQEVSGHQLNTSEIDWVEMQLGSTTDWRAWSGGDIGGAEMANVWQNNIYRGSNWQFGFNYGTTQLAPQEITFGGVWSRRETFFYLNGVMMENNRYRWTSTAKAQLGTNLAYGSINPNYCANLLMPYKNSNLANANFKIKQIKIWGL